jgi:hypothetical protein
MTHPETLSPLPRLRCDECVDPRLCKGGATPRSSAFDAPSDRASDYTGHAIGCASAPMERGARAKSVEDRAMRERSLVDLRGRSLLTAPHPTREDTRALTWTAAFTLS